MSFKQPKYKQKNVKPKRKKHSKKYFKKQLLLQNQKLINKTKKCNNINPEYFTLREILEMINKKYKHNFYGGIYFGRTHDLKYYNAPEGTPTGKEFWRLDELTEEMLNLKFHANSWYLESGDLMFDQI